MKSKRIPDNQIAFYEAPDGSVNIEVLYAEENIWLPQRRIAELFDTTPQNVTQHLKNIYLERELEENATCKDFLRVQKEGDRAVERNLTFYSLEAIIAVGYRVNSERGTQFRGWATGILKNYIHKGYALDNDRFKYGSRFSARFFDELYEEIRDIRASERMLYQKITDVYATSLDYASKAPETKKFFATVQNKLHFAITGKTAAEIIAARASCKKEHMGLTSWRRSPEGKVMPSDVVVAKNYLQKDEITDLNRIVNMYLDYAEMQAARRKPMYMKDWIEKLDAFLKFNEHDLLTNAGKVSHDVAEALALGEYEKFKKVQDVEYRSDFDEFVEKARKIEQESGREVSTKESDEKVGQRVRKGLK